MTTCAAQKKILHSDQNMLLAWERLSPHASNQEVHMAERMLWRGFKNTRFSEDLSLSSSGIPLRVSKAVLLRHLTPRTSISLNFRLQKHLNVVERGTWRENERRLITATYG